MFFCFCFLVSATGCIELHEESSSRFVRVNILVQILHPETKVKTKASQTVRPQKRKTNRRMKNTIMMSASAQTKNESNLEIYSDFPTFHFYRRILT